MSAPVLPAIRPPRAAWIGTLVSLSVVIAWAVHLVVVLANVDTIPWWAPGPILVQTFLHTGLFIVAHDAMHGSVAPGWPRINNAIGQLCLILYALFPMSALKRAHVEHHRAPGTETDPDHTGGEPLDYARWYLRFMTQYLRWYQIAGMALIFNVAAYGLGIDKPILTVFWVVPSLLSTFQLFTFGTYLPHRIPAGGHTDNHAARSSDWPPWLSLVTCYHFGYHWEHHEFPGVPWWRLPLFRRAVRGMRTT